MQIFILILAIVIIAAIMGGAIWLASHIKRKSQGGKPAKETGKAESLSFHLSYIILPVAVLFLCIILTAFFYHRLPPDIAYNMKSGDSPDKWLSREAILAWMLIPQLFLALVAGGITWGITKLGILSRQPADALVKPERLLSFMGNMIALPQLILAFAMLDIFSYNSYQVHIMPLWVFALIVMGAGAIVLGIFFIQAIRQAWISNR